MSTTPARWRARAGAAGQGDHSCHTGGCLGRAVVSTPDGEAFLQEDTKDRTPSLAPYPLKPCCSGGDLLPPAQEWQAEHNSVLLHKPSRPLGSRAARRLSTVSAAARVRLLSTVFRTPRGCTHRSLQLQLNISASQKLVRFYLGWEYSIRPMNH